MCYDPDIPYLLEEDDLDIIEVGSEEMLIDLVQVDWIEWPGDHI